jgi:uncharacterized protein (TIGR03067 family)
MRTLMVLGVSLLVLADADSQEDATRRELARLNGIWKYTKVEAPDKIAEAIAEASVVEFRDGKMIHTITLSTGKKEVAQATVRLDPSKRPKHFDVTSLDGPEKGKTTQGIYELDDDALRIAYEDGQRPTDFTFKKGSIREVYTLKRVKK